jgi:hypothetical protein
VVSISGLPAAVLVPVEPERHGHLDGQVDVEMEVVDVDVPAEYWPHVPERDRVVDEADEIWAVCGGAEQVHRSGGLPLAAEPACCGVS